MPRPTKVTFPGSVRFTDPAAAQALRIVRNYDPKTKEFTGTTVRIPAGKRASYESKPGIVHKLPTFTVTLVDDVPAVVVHAELEHETKPVTFTRVVKAATKKTDAVTRETVSDVATGVITATSTEHEGIAGQGKSAAEAVQNMKSAVTLHLAKKAAAAKAEAEAKAKEEAEEPVITPAPAAHPEIADEVVTREG